MKTIMRVLDQTVRFIAGLWCAGLFALGAAEGISLLLDYPPQTMLALGAFGLSGIGAIGLLIAVRG